MKRIARQQTGKARPSARRGGAGEAGRRIERVEAEAAKTGQRPFSRLRQPGDWPDPASPVKRMLMKGLKAGFGPLENGDRIVVLNSGPSAPKGGKSAPFSEARCG